MRKAIACVLAALQLAFGGVLILNGGRAERERNKKIDGILENGTELLFDIVYFEYFSAPDSLTPMLTFYLYSETWDYLNGYYPLTANERGVAVFGASVPRPPAEPYYALWEGETYYRLNEASVKAAFGADAEDGYHNYNRHWLHPERNRFMVNGEWVPVYAVGTVYGGDIVFTGVMVGDRRY